MFTLVLVLNAVWFASAFVYFTLLPRKAARILVLRDQRTSPLFDTVAAAVTFLGGMNLALSVFAGLILVFLSLFPDRRQHALFALIFAIAHGSQFGGNLPLAIRERITTRSVWSVLSGPMFFIFVVDGVMTVANGAAAFLLLVPTA